jgi:uncharacterized membrane protein
VIERTYLEGCALGFSNIAEQHSLAVSHYDDIKQRFKALLARPDKRVQLVTQFQKVRPLCQEVCTQCQRCAPCAKKYALSKKGVKGRN